MNGRTVLALLIAGVLLTACKRTEHETFYELTIDERDFPQLRVVTSGWWMYASNLWEFTGKTGPSPLKITSVLSGHVTWRDAEHSDLAKIRIEWSGDFDSRLECLGMSESTEHPASGEAKVVIPLPRGKKTTEFECHVLQIYPTEPRK